MMKVKEPLFEYISPQINYQVKNEDCLSVLKKIEDNKFDLIITSLPYNVGESYHLP
jgi:site-specific DNA-methyltransferase (adenine-specific)/adenine-specific DNA-methyltransferase